MRHAERHADFIRANTRLLPVPLVPEVQLHLAEESLAIWRQTEEELGRMNVPPPWWAFAWAGGQALARYVLDNSALAAGRSVLDLGAGSGLAGIAALKAGAARVLAADTDPFAVAAIGLNAAVNRVAMEATDRDLLAAPPAPYDLLLVGDPRRSYFPNARFEPVAEYSVPVTRDLEDMEIKRTAVWRLA